MNLGFWDKLKKNKPIIALAPMADVTDVAFRTIIAKYSRMGKPGGGPDVLWTEFVSADGLCSRGKEKLLHILEYKKSNRPIVAQVFGSNPENMEKACAMIAKLGFDGIDINMGCPDRKVEKQGAGSALIKNPDLAVEIIRSAKRGAPKLPISVKTRIGFNKVEIEKWLPKLLAEDIAVLTVHARTRKELSLVPANWEYVKRAVEIRDEMALGRKTLIFGNGDVVDLSDAYRKASETGADGVMIGRGVFGRPWLFDRRNVKITTKEKLKILVEHTKLFEKLLSKPKMHQINFAVMKKHFKAYVSGFDGAKELRVKLMETQNAKEVEAIVADFLTQ